MERPASMRTLFDVVADAGAGVEAGRKRLGEADAEVDRRDLADSDEGAGQLQGPERQRRRLLDEAEVVRPQHLVEVEVFELGGARWLSTCIISSGVMPLASIPATKEPALVPT